MTISNKINHYLASGGLFNPEAVEHDKVRDMLLEIRKELQDEHQDMRVKKLEYILDRIGDLPIISIRTPDGKEYEMIEAGALLKLMEEYDG